MTRAGIAFLAVVCAALVAHLLFIPYAFSPLPFDEAIRQFAHIPWMRLGSDQNVALVSRGLMFLPLGLLLAATVAPLPQRRIEWLALFVAIVLGCGWATTVNLAQLWFPTRTVSLNNLAAEFVGVTAGGFLWAGLGATALRWRRQLAAGGRISLNAALTGYVIIYLLASLAPFDFVTNIRELDAKIASNLLGLWIAPISCGVAPCKLKFLMMMAATIPCGWWFAAHRPADRRPWIAATLVGLLAAAAIELLHFLMVSGVSQGASVLARTAGMVIGTATFSSRHRFSTIGRFSRPAILALLVPYLAAIAYVAGWFRAPKLDVYTGLARLSEVVWLPFYYQYYAPYQSTMQSAIVHTALYAPVGAMCWLWAKRRDRASVLTGGVLAALLAFAAETSKVFLAGRLPDYTDVMIAGAAAALALTVLRSLSRSPQLPLRAKPAPTRKAGDAPPSTERHAAAPIRQAAGMGPRLAGVALIAVAVWSVIRFPVGAAWLAAVLLPYAALLLRYPLAYLVLVPPLLLVFDLAPFSGRFFWDELDIVLAVTLGVRLLGGKLQEPVIATPKPGFGLLVASLVASTAIGLWPPAPLDANAFSTYLSTYNALRVAKGYAWAGALLWLIRRDADAGGKAVRAIQLGLGLALFAGAIGVILERLTFVDFRELGTSFRAAGLVSATHVGGAYMEAALVILAPFGLALAVGNGHRSQRAFWYLVVLLGAGALLATLSRAAFAAWPMAIATFALAWWFKSRAPLDVTVATGVRWGTSIALLALLAVPVVASQSTYLRERLLASGTDLSTRLTHWKATVDLMKTDPLHWVAGVGLGRFPREFYLANAWDHRLPAYRVERDVLLGSNYLLLTGGTGMFMDQRVVAPSGAALLLTGRVRGSQTDAALSVSLCEKSFLNSVACDDTTIKVGSSWQPFEVRMGSPQRARKSLIPGSPLALSLHNGMFGSRVEVTGLSLADGQRELLDNGSFEHGLDHWLVTSDVHLAWRALSTPIQVLFEQGALGLLAWLVVLSKAFATLGRRTGAPSVGAAFVAAVVGFLVVGCFDSLLDSPRVILLLALAYGAYLGSSVLPLRPFAAATESRERPSKIR